MELVEALGTISDKDHRSYVKIETLHGKNLTKIHKALIDFCMTLTKYITIIFCIISVVVNNED